MTSNAARYSLATSWTLRRFDSQAAAEDAAHVLRIEVLGSDPQAQVFRLGDQEIHVVYAGGGQYLKSFR